MSFPEKEEAKKIGAKWDSEKRIWYARKRDNANLKELIKYCKEIDRAYLMCPSESRKEAISKGVSVDSKGRLFIPNWYWIDSSISSNPCIKHTVNITRMWLPREHEAYADKPYNYGTWHEGI